jgi:hypothetical protein
MCWLSSRVALRLGVGPTLLPYALSFFDSLSYFRLIYAAFLEEVLAMKM